MWALWTALGIAWAHPAVEALDRGDEAWFTGNRRAGARAWRQAVELGDGAPEGRAAEAMARLRLLRASCSLAPLWHGPRYEDALQGCGEGPWCVLALADFHLMVPVELGADRERGRELAESIREELPGRAASRLAWASGDTTPVLAVEPEARDGLGRALVVGRVVDPGPWVLGVGVLAGHATGWGLGVHLVHPDLLRRRVRGALDGFVATGAVGGGGYLETAGRVGAVLSGHASRTRWWDGTGWVPVDSARVQPGVVLRLGPVAARAGPLVRWETDQGEVFAGHGAWASARVDGRTWRSGRPAGVWVGVGGELALSPIADYARQGGWVDLRAYQPAGKGVLAGRVRGEGALGEMPAIRLPTVGGSSVLRGARPGSLRGRWTAAAEAELRYPVWGPLWVAAFGGGAAVEGSGIHPGGGAGVRWVLPPQPRNTVRLDLGVTDVGVELVVAYGEAF